MFREVEVKGIKQDDYQTSQVTRRLLAHAAPVLFLLTVFPHPPVPVPLITSAGLRIHIMTRVSQRLIFCG